MGEDFVCRRTVDADPKHLGVAVFEFGDISLIRLELSGSTSGESQNIEGEDNVLFAEKIAQLHLIPVLIR